MIVVAGFNTAMDRRISLSSPLAPGAVQRAAGGETCPGGKGLHVAQMAAELGESVCLVGLTDAIHAESIARHLQSRRVRWLGVESPHELRQCLAIYEPDGRVTEILEPGDELDAGVQKTLLATLDALLDEADALILSGSLPRGFPVDTYAALARDAARRGLPCLVDASGETLLRAVEAGPWLVKPNAEEAAAITGRPVRDVASAFECVRELHRRGVARAVVTLGSEGCMGFDGSTLCHVWSDPGVVRNSVGSGDCFLAALAVGAVRGEAFEVSLRRAVASGAANAANAETGFADAREVEARLPQVHVRTVDADRGESSRHAV